MLEKNEFYIGSSNQKNKLRGMIWQPESKIFAIVQISHGMIEHIERYDTFARYLAERGFLVVGSDHLAHGKTAATSEELGYFPSPHPSQTVVEDLHLITLHMKAQYPNVPYFLLGHSMGSFMARRYLMTYGKELDGALILGTGEPSHLMLGASQLMLRLLRCFKPDTHRSQFANTVSFGSYNDHFKPKRTEYDWLSRDPKVVDAYMTDPYCQYLFTLNGYQTLLDTFAFIKDTSHISNIPKDLPIILAAGTEDPVGDYGKTVEKIYHHYQKAGIRDITLKLYAEDRHELLNELDKEVIFADLYSWVVAHLPK